MCETFNSKLALHLLVIVDDEKINPVASHIIHSFDAAPVLPSDATSSSDSATSADRHSRCDSSLLRARIQAALPIRLSGMGLRSIVETMSFAYIASIVRVMYEDEKWWENNGLTYENNFTFVNHLEEAIEITDQSLTSKKDKQLFPRDTDIPSFIARFQAKEREEKRNT
jgi:hypothetical protein